MIPERPEVGLVFRYAFLWRHEAARGQIEGAKDRPALVLALVIEADQVLAAPITTKPPEDPEAAIEIPERVRRHIGLDADRCWISVDTLNQFTWPGPDIRPIPGGSPTTAVYGLVPQQLLDRARALAVARLARRVPGLVVKRSE